VALSICLRAADGVDFSVISAFAVPLLLYIPRTAKLKTSEPVISRGRVMRESLPAAAACVLASEANSSSEKLYYLV
jgi:hypothetical protein